MLKKVLIVLALLVVLLLGLLFYLGLFSTPQVTEKPMGGITYAYREFIGDYKKTGPVFQQVNDELVASGLNPSRGLGVYFDDPRQVPADKLRSYCGAIIEGADLQKTVSLPSSVNIGLISTTNSVIVELPIKNSLSYMVGPIKAYPILSKYIASKKYQVLQAYEIYDIPAKKISYVMQVK